MSKNSQRQPNSDLNHQRYLFINLVGLLDPIVASQATKDDLVIKQLEEGIFYLLKDGKRIFESLDELVNQHRYSIALYSIRKEYQITQLLKSFEEALQKVGLKWLTKISTLIIKEHKDYREVRANNPSISVSEDISHGIIIAGCNIKPLEQIEVLDGISKFLDISKSDWNSYLVLDNRPTFVNKASREGWNTCEVETISLKKFLGDLCQKLSEPRVQKAQQHLEGEEEKMDITEKPIDQSREISEKTPEDVPLPLQCSIESQHRQNIEVSELSIQEIRDAKRDEENFSQPLETGSDICEKEVESKGPLVQQIMATKEEETEPLISNMKFELVKGEGPGGSSITKWFLDAEDNTSKWVGKCSFASIASADSYKNFDEYKEYLAGKIYNLFGAKIPDTVLTFQCLDKKIQAMDLFKSYKDIDKPKLHIMSKFVAGFELLGDVFIEEYKNSSRNNKKEPFCMCRGHMGRKPLRGFGRVMAIAIFVQDYDFIGNTGRNIGFVPNDTGEYYEIIKIDPGEGLTPEEDLEGIESIRNPLEKKEAVVGTLGQRINFDDLNNLDQKEFVQTLKETLEVKDSKLEEVFRPFLKSDDRFTAILEELLNRKKGLLAVFSGEVGGLINRYIRSIEEQIAQKQVSRWGGQPLLLQAELEQKRDLVKDKAQLEAFAGASKGPQVLQIFAKKERFVGRDSELAQLKQQFSANIGTVIGCTIVGGAGLGKSQLAAEYVMRNHKEMYSQVVWIHAEQGDLISDQMQIYLETHYKIKFDPQDKNKKGTIVKIFYEKLENEEGKCIEDDNAKEKKSLKKSCVIFDNVDGMAQIADYLPGSKHSLKVGIDILVTSRYKKWNKPFERTLDLQAFDLEETKNYLKEYFPSLKGEEGLEDDELAKNSQRINALLGGLPLALSLAVAYIQQREFSVSKFCDLVAGKEFIPLQDQQEIQDHGENDNSKQLNIVSTVLTLALSDLRSKNQCVEPILDILAYLSPESIRMNLLEECWDHCRTHNALDSLIDRFSKPFLQSMHHQQSARENWEEVLDINKIHEQFSELGKKDEFDKALEFLFSYSIVNINTANLIQNQVNENENESIGPIAVNVMEIKVHQLTQQVIRLNHQRSSIYDNRYQNVFDWVLTELKYNDKDLRDIERAGFLIPHAMYLECLQNKMDEKNVAALLGKIGNHQLNGAGKYDIALKYYGKALLLKEKLYGKDHVETGFTLGSVGNAWGSLGDYEKQKDHLIRALEIKEKYYGRDHPETAVTLANLGSAWGSLGHYKKQRDNLNIALEIFEKHYGSDHAQTAAALTNLGNAYGSLGDHEKQKDLLERALVSKEKVYGRDHPQIAVTLTNLGDAWGFLGDYNTQKDLLTRALGIFEKHFGKVHPKTATALSSLGDALGLLGDYRGQREILTQALEIQEKYYVKGHPEIGITLGNLGNACGSLGDYEKQKDYLTTTLEIFRKHYGTDHPMTGIAMCNLGNAWGSLGDYEKQKELLTQALEIDEKHYGKNHPGTANTLSNLGNALGSLGDHEKQKDLLIRALEIEEKHYGKDHPETGKTLGNLANALGSLGDREKQITLLARVLEIFEKNYGRDHIQTGIALNNLGDAWGSSGNYEKKADLLSRALKIYEKHYGKEHLETASILVKLGNAWESLDEYEKQRDILTRALEIKEKYYGKDHPEIGAILTDLGDAWGSLEEHEKQVDLLTQALKIKEKQCGKDDPQVAVILYNLGNGWGSLGDHEKQKDLLSRALEIDEKHYEKDHSQLVATLTDLGEAYGSLGDYKKQIDLLTRALEINEKNYGKEHPETGDALANIGNAWASLGDFEKQIAFLNRALEIFENSAEDHPQIATILGSLGNAWGVLGDAEKEAEFSGRAFEIFQTQYEEKNYESDEELE